MERNYVCIAQSRDMRNTCKSWVLVPRCHGYGKMENTKLKNLSFMYIKCFCYSLIIMKAFSKLILNFH
jgi:hypothetical protein